MKHNSFYFTTINQLFFIYVQHVLCKCCGNKNDKRSDKPMITIFNRQKLIECYTEEIRMKAGCSMSQPKNYQNGLLE